MAELFKTNEPVDAAAVNEDVHAGEDLDAELVDKEWCVGDTDSQEEGVRVLWCEFLSVVSGSALPIS